MNKNLICFWWAVLMLVTGAASAQSQNINDIEDSLLKSWEEIQQNDPKTVKFERIGPRLYRFHTKWFPFDGTLRVLNVAVDDTPGWADGDSKMGVVEVELEGLSEGFMSKHAHSYTMWQQDNMLFFDPVSQGWVNSDEYYARQSTQPNGSSCSIRQFGSLFWILFLVLCILVLILIGRKASGQMNTAMSAHEKALAEQTRAIQLTEKAIKISEDSNRLLGEILRAIEGSKKS